MRFARAAAAIAVFAALAGSADVRAESPAIPESARKAVEKAAMLLAKAGRATETNEALGILGDLGAEAAPLAKLRDACAKAVAKAGKSAPAVPDAAKALRLAAAELAAGLDGADEPATSALAQSVLRLDGTHAAARRVLGHVHVDGVWRTKEEAACLPRRAEIAAAVVAARKLDIPVEVDASTDAALLAVTGKQGIRMRWGNVEVHGSTVPRERLERILKQAVRAEALSQWLRRGNLEPVPLAFVGRKFVFYGTPAYREPLVDHLRGRGLLGQTEAARIKTTRPSCIEVAGHEFHVVDAFEGNAAAFLAYHLWCQAGYEAYGGDPQQCLIAGHMDWVIRQVIGATLPNITWVEVKEGSAGGVTSDGSDRREREELFRIGQRSVAGARAWMRWLARRGEDPAWARSMVDQIGLIGANDRLKCTIVAEYLQEAGRIDHVFQATRGKTPIPPAFEAALGEKLGDFEARWRTWILGCESGLAERVERGPSAQATPEEVRVLARLGEMRRAAVLDPNREIVVPLQTDPDLTAGCLAHARYLNRNPAQKTAWPDAHEEWADREGFTVEGARAGLASVVYPGVTSAEQAIDGWVATFYHRLPLLDPGLLRIGWALEGGTAVLDAGSMSSDVPRAVWVVWPPVDGKGVPRSFVPELPNPVPGADQAAWGFPVTVQCFGLQDPPKLTMRLLQGAKPVDCHFATPDEPTNPDLAPGAAWCLIPKATLLPGASYTVVVEGMPGTPKYQWSFVTGK